MSALGGTHPPQSTMLAAAVGAAVGAGPFVASFGRLGASGHPVADGFVVRPLRSGGTDPFDLDGAGREELGSQLGALELRCGRRLGDPARPLRLTVLALPRVLDVPIDHELVGSPSGAAPSVRGVGTLAALRDAIRSLRARFPRRTLVAIALPDERTVRFTGTLVTRDAVHGTIATRSSWSPGPRAGVERAPEHAIQAHCDELAAAAEVACSDMCCVSVAIVDGTPTVMAITPAVRSPLAALRVAVDLRDHGLIGKAEALRRVPLSLFVAEAGGPARGTASTDVARLLEWADQAPRVPVTAAADCPLPTVRCAADVAALDPAAAAALIEPTGDPRTVGDRLWEIADAVDARGIDGAALALTDALRRATGTALPALPWRAVVGPEHDPAARVLAARLGAPPDDPAGRRLA